MYVRKQRGVFVSAGDIVRAILSYSAHRLRLRTACGLLTIGKAETFELLIPMVSSGVQPYTKALITVDAL